MNFEILHILPDQGTSDYFIENTEKIAPGKSHYAVRNAKGGIKKINSPLAKAYGLDELIELAERPQTKRIIIHFLKDHAVDLLLRLKSKAKVIWVFWGADGYLLPSLDKNSTLAESLKLDSKARNKWYHFYMMDFLRKLYKSRKQDKLIQAVKRVDACATWVKGDVDLIKHYGRENMEYLFFSYYSVHQLVGEVPERIEENKREKYVLLGNSASATNNHIEGLKFLKEKGWKDKVVMPLSYGNKDYLAGLKRLSDKVLPGQVSFLTEFLSKDKYHDIIKGASLMFMNHVRQQAAGNTLAALWMGIPLLMQEQSTLTKQYKAWGLQFLDNNNFALEKIGTQNSVIVEKNRSILMQEMGDEKILEAYNQLLFK